MNTIYNSLPVFLQNLAINIYAGHLNITRYSKKFDQFFKNYLTNLDKWHKKELNHQINQNIYFFLRKANDSPYWCN
ncbi:MAG: hypothetical protein WD512_11420, partial [Candidatus Paceibacterota bacterium]